jgi:hypothetical protein
MRKVDGQLGQSIVRNQSNNAVRQWHHIMIKALQGEAVEVGEIAGDVEGGNDACASLHVDRPAEPTVDQ